MEYDDPRTAATTILDGPPDLVGRQAVKIESATIDGTRIRFPAPLLGVAEYMVVANAEANTNRLRPQLVEGLEPMGDGTYWQGDADLVYVTAASAGTAVATAITGVESFANHLLMRAFDSAPTVTLPNGTTYTKAQALDRPVHERVGDLLPVVTGRPSLKQQHATWQVLRRVQRLAVLVRHALYESQPVGKGLNDEGTVYDLLFSGGYIGVSRMMLDLFEHCSPGWIDAERMSRLPPPP